MDINSVSEPKNNSNDVSLLFNHKRNTKCNYNIKIKHNNNTINDETISTNPVIANDSSKYLHIQKPIKEKSEMTLLNEPSINKHRRKHTSRTNTLYILLRMCVKHSVLLKQWMICVLLCSVSGYREQKFAMEPQDQVRHI